MQYYIPPVNDHVNDLLDTYLLYYLMQGADYINIDLYL